VPDLHSFTLFLIAAFVIIVVPGPAVLYIAARSIDQGRLAGFISALGVAVGAMVHVAAAALGISALLVSSAVAFSVVKYLGAAYLIYLGVRKLMVREELKPLERQPKPATHEFFCRAWWSTHSIPRPRFSSLPFCRSSLIPRAGRWLCRSLCWALFLRSSGFSVTAFTRLPPERLASGGRETCASCARSGTLRGRCTSGWG
jgi:hypothetical protein